MKAKAFRSERVPIFQFRFSRLAADSEAQDAIDSPEGDADGDTEHGRTDGNFPDGVAVEGTVAARTCVEGDDEHESYSDGKQDLAESGTQALAEIDSCWNSARKHCGDCGAG